VIDLHCHVLPGIDDGPRDAEESIALLTGAARSGVRVVAATPHLRPDHPGVDVAELSERCERLALRLPPGVDVELVPAAEVDALLAQGASDEVLRLASYGQRGTDLLVETPYGGLPPNFEELLFAITVRGFRILLAHPERSRDLQARPQRLEDLVRRGVLLQITAPALLARRRAPARRLAVALIERGLAHVLASDAHSARGPRPPTLADAVEAASGVDPRRARWMVEDAPAAILAGEPLPPAPAGPPRGLLRRRPR
jgi:protein-tyrosine phosphatase